jgi:hypothetical protein
LYLVSSSSNVSKWNCKKCPDGGSCKGSIDGSQVKPMFGWWPHKHLNFIKCIRPQSCLGKPNVGLNDTFPVGAMRERKIFSCAPEFAHFNISQPNRFCATCAKGYVRGSQPGQCKKCIAFWDNFWLVVLSVLCGILGTGFLIKITVFSPRITHHYDGVKKIGLSYFQLASLALQVHVPWQNNLMIFLNFQRDISSVPLTMYSLDCIFTDRTTWEMFRLKYAMLVFTPIIIVPILYLTILKSCKFCRGGKDEILECCSIIMVHVIPNDHVQDCYIIICHC